VNRFGLGDAHIDLVHTGDEVGAPSGAALPVDGARRATFEILDRLPRRRDGLIDASPSALSALVQGLTPEERRAAFSPQPFIPNVSDFLFDAWALTSIRERSPNRPDVADWIHGVSGWEPPTTTVAWREEVDVIRGPLIDQFDPEELLDAYPLKPHEVLSDRTDRVRKHLASIVIRHPDAQGWLIAKRGDVRVVALTSLTGDDRSEINPLADCAILLAPAVGGLSRGRLDGSEPFRDEEKYDVADSWFDELQRTHRSRGWELVAPPPGMRLVQTVNLQLLEPADSEPVEPRIWRWYARPNSADDDGSRTALFEQALERHLVSAEAQASQMAKALGLGSAETVCIRLAARWHDIGKARAVWQRSIGNREFPKKVLAKSANRMQPSALTHYRHEFGSLMDLRGNGEFTALNSESQDLVLHLIAAHHGRSRPWFPTNETFDFSGSEHEVHVVGADVPRRFGRLQKRYGRWGLAFLESVIRAADVLASAPESISPGESVGP
jgi:CRISPR-associated endonuclease/helicase Cas3